MNFDFSKKIKGINDDYGVNPWFFLFLYFGTSPLFLYFFYRSMKNLIENNIEAFFFNFLIDLFIFLLPFLYVLFFGRNLPKKFYFYLFLFVILLAMFSFYKLIAVIIV